MVVGTCFQRLDVIIDYVDFLCETVIRREANETEEFVLNKFEINIISIYKLE